MYVYGGTTGGNVFIILALISIESELAADDLYMLDLKQGEENAAWYIVPVAGTTPGRRYGHTMVFADPCLVIFGGTTGTSLEANPFSNVITL
jgi:protein phosphatase